MVSEKSKKTIDNLSESELRHEIEKGRTSRFQRDKYAYLKVCLLEIESKLKHNISSKNKTKNKQSFFKREWNDGEKWGMGILGALLTTAVITVFSLYFSNGDDVIRSVSFKTLPSHFGIKSELSGDAKVTKNNILVMVKSAVFTLENPFARVIVDIRAVLAKPNETSWEVVRTSERITFGITLKNKESNTQQDFEFLIPLANLESVAGHYLIFDISEIGLSDKSLGTSHAHTRPDLF